ncbi:MAG: hypothetical protein CW691_10665 [Candidatus Bathyarchaeum sp.]|nr:MAG: hypothetical protein CW691_10665 [Candidatus Bathyarchaeum sp.]
MFSCSDKGFNQEGAFRFVEGVLFLRFKSQVLKVTQILKGAIRRNILIVKATSLAFFIMLAVAIIGSVIVFCLVPSASDSLSSIVQTVFDYDDVPGPFTLDFFSYIFTNNSGHFWNPIRMLVWVPAVGPLLLGFEILLNSGVIGVVAVMVGMNNGLAYPIIGLVPHGIIEIPAFLLQFACIVLWQATVTEVILAKLRGKQVDTKKAKRGLKDTLILAVASIILLFVAAAIETYVTPYLLGL